MEHLDSYVKSKRLPARTWLHDSLSSVCCLSFGQVTLHTRRERERERERVNEEMIGNEEHLAKDRFLSFQRSFTCALARYLGAFAHQRGQGGKSLLACWKDHVICGELGWSQRGGGPSKVRCLAAIRPILVMTIGPTTIMASRCFWWGPRVAWEFCGTSCCFNVAIQQSPPKREMSPWPETHFS